MVNISPMFTAEYNLIYNPGLIAHLKCHAPAMYRLYEIMKSRSDPPTDEEIEIASAQKVLDPKAAACYLEKLC